MGHLIEKHVRFIRGVRVIGGEVPVFRTVIVFVLTRLSFLVVLSRHDDFWFSVAVYLQHVNSNVLPPVMMIMIAIIGRCAVIIALFVVVSLMRMILVMMLMMRHRRVGLVMRTQTWIKNRSIRSFLRNFNPPLFVFFL